MQTPPLHHRTPFKEMPYIANYDTDAIDCKNCKQTCEKDAVFCKHQFDFLKTHPRWKCLKIGFFLSMRHGLCLSKVVVFFNGSWLYLLLDAMSDPLACCGKEIYICKKFGK